MRASLCITSLGISLVVVFEVSCSRSIGSENNDAGDVRASTNAPVRIGSCDRAEMTGTCSEYAGSYLTGNEVFLTSSCGKLGGTFVYAECPNTSVVGACTLSTGEVRKFYATGSAAFTPDRAQSECLTAFRGSWKTR